MCIPHTPKDEKGSGDATVADDAADEVDDEPYLGEGDDDDDMESSIEDTGVSSSKRCHELLKTRPDLSTQKLPKMILACG